MKKKYAALLVAMVIIFGGMLMLATRTFADSTSAVQGQICAGVGEATSDGSIDCSGKTSSSSINSLISTVVNLLSVVVGIVAIVMLIFSGFRFITSGGESGAVAAARKGIIYALIGIVVVALAQFIVHFVLNKANLVTSPPPTSQSSSSKSSSQQP